MITTLKVRMNIKEPEQYVNYNHSSLFQGVLMEFIDKDYGDFLHDKGLKPYSQHIEKDDIGYLWIINTLNEESSDRIIKPIVNKKPSEILLRHSNISFSIEDMNVSQITYDKLIRKNYIEENTRSYFTIKFITPTSFKSNDKYVLFPNIELIFRSLINKYNLFARDYEVDDKEILKFIVNNTEIIDYKLKSTRFHLEGVKIPSFLGEIRLKIKGPITTKNLISLLFDFGQYSGIGIKNAIGMGTIKKYD